VISLNVSELLLESFPSPRLNYLVSDRYEQAIWCVFTQCDTEGELQESLFTMHVNSNIGLLITKRRRERKKDTSNVSPIRVKGGTNRWSNMTVGYITNTENINKEE